LVAGACLLSALPVNIVMAQELVPRHASTVSGFVMGFAWGMGGLAAPGLGALADHWGLVLGELAGLTRAMDLIPLLPLAGALLAIALPETRPGRASDAAPHAA
jgi:FSR family fosmidomycin resistance protein-like MFS transporter